jgi:hypothetical protein
MAVTAQPQEEEQTQEGSMNVVQDGTITNQTTQEGSQQPTQTTQPAPTAPTQQPAQQQPQQPQQPLQQSQQPLPQAARGGSGSYTNIGQYLQANKAQTQKLAERIRQRHDQQAENFRKQLDKRREKEMGAQSAIGQEQSRLAGGQQFIQQQIQQAQAGQKAEADALKRFTQFRTGQGSLGPQQPITFGKEQQEAERIRQEAAGLATRKGQLGALKKLTRGASRGESALDRQLLAMSRPSALRGKDLREQARQTAGYLDTLRGDVSGALEQNVAQRRALQEATGTQLGTAQTGLETGIQESMEAERARLGDIRSQAASAREAQMADIAEYQQGLKGQLQSGFGKRASEINKMYQQGYNLYHDMVNNPSRYSGDNSGIKYAQDLQKSKDAFNRAISQTRQLFGKEGQLHSDVLGTDFNREFRDQVAGGSLLDHAQYLGTKFGAQGADARYKAIQKKLNELANRGASASQLDAYANKQLADRGYNLGDIRAELQDIDPSAVTRQTAATQDQYRQAQALAALAGRQTDLLDESLAGTASTDLARRLGYTDVIERGEDIL